MSAAEETGLTLRGLMHSAVVLDDQIVAGLSKDSLERVWAPKAIGALRLHVAHRPARARLVGRLLVDVVTAGRARAGRLRRRQRVARRPGRLATGVGFACHHDQLGPVVRHRRRPLADVQCAGSHFAGRRHRGAGGHPGQPPHQHRGGPAAAGPGRGRVPGDPATRLFREVGRGTGHRQRGRRLGRPRRVARAGPRRGQPGRHRATGRAASWPSWATRRAARSTPISR